MASTPRLDVVNFGDYDVMVRPGTSDTLVIFLASLGEPGKVPHFEWQGVVEEAGLDAHVVFFRDRTKSWFNSPKGWADVVDWFRSHQAEHRIARTIAIGVSMGGFGAALLAQHIPVQRVIAISPQASVDPDLAFDRRYSNYWRALADEGGAAWPDLSRAKAAGTEYLCFYTIDDHFDVGHAALLAGYETGWRLFAFRGDHNIAGTVRHQGRHVAWIRGLLQPIARFTEGDEVADHGRYFSDQAAVAAGDLVGLRARAEDYLDRGEAAKAPLFLYPLLSSAGFDRLLRSMRSNGRALRAHAYPIAPDIPILGDNLRHYLTYGWGSEVENDGVWSIGELHSIRANLLTPDAAGSYRLNLAVGVFLPSLDHEQIIKVYADGRAVATFAFSGRDFVLTDLPIPVRGPCIDLLFETPHAISPRAAGLSADARPLAFKVRYFCVDRQLEITATGDAKYPLATSSGRRARPFLGAGHG